MLQKEVSAISSFSSMVIMGKKKNQSYKLSYHNIICQKKLTNNLPDES